MSDTTPTLSEVIRERVQAFLDGVHLALPARVERYDAAKQCVDVQPVIQQAYLDEAGDRQVERLPVITNVPVCFPRAGGYRITFPVSQGDTVLLVFSEQALDVWLSEGGEVDPLDDRRSHLKDAVALLGLSDFKHALSDAPDDHMTLGKDGGLQIHISGGKIQIGSETGAELEAAALGDTLETYLGLLDAWFVSLLAWSATVTPSFTLPRPPLPATFKSSSIEVKK